jgi:hypothetical protein
MHRQLAAELALEGTDVGYREVDTLQVGRQLAARQLLLPSPTPPRPPDAAPVIVCHLGKCHSVRG